MKLNIRGVTDKLLVSKYVNINVHLWVFLLIDEILLGISDVYMKKYFDSPVY